ncbi:hypothetical protein BU14_2952s0001 [Porphyra umbilicalis]|uniref:Uncharacterized protein n=1 Tax=Porphyra umbilicalis TaxID=2786 RepID=A0A1X6NIA1_PORUM|nr:hypothetical protein BU14_2952s0001 [Porphyra umbilicalis]|eukprot:OSX68351.1 hypothetical protein BU14_2952s0001 [Porphyra umbilicalis]
MPRSCAAWALCGWPHPLTRDVASSAVAKRMGAPAASVSRPWSASPTTLTSDRVELSTPGRRSRRDNEATTWLMLAAVSGCHSRVGSSTRMPRGPPWAVPRDGVAVGAWGSGNVGHVDKFEEKRLPSSLLGHRGGGVCEIWTATLCTVGLFLMDRAAWRVSWSSMVTSQGRLSEIFHIVQAIAD